MRVKIHIGYLIICIKFWVSNNLHKILVIAADTPLLALKKFYQNEDLQIVKVDEKDANVKVELLSGQRKTKNFYFVKG